MNHTTPNAHPFFAIDISRNFEIEPDELRALLKRLPNWKFVELEGIDTDGSKVDLIYLWHYPDTAAPLCEDQCFELVERLDKAGFDINPDDVTIVDDYQTFTCECCNFAPVLALEEMSCIEGINCNIDNPKLYVQLAARRAAYARQENM